MAAAVAPTFTREPLPEGWHEAFCTHFKRNYWYNKVCLASVLDLPSTPSTIRPVFAVQARGEVSSLFACMAVHGAPICESFQSCCSVACLESPIWQTCDSLARRNL